MKKIIKKFWGVALIVTLLASMLISAVPAAAGTLKFSDSLLPGAKNQILANSNIDLVKVASNGDIFALDKDAKKLYKSTNGGYTWAATTIAADSVSDIAISPSYTTDSTVFALVKVGADVVVFRSVNAGTSFAQYGGAIVTGAYMGTSIALEPTYMSGVGMIIAGYSDGAAGGSVKVWGKSGTLTWESLGGAPLVGDISAVAFSPLYPIDSLIFAIGSDGADTYVNAVITAAGTWNQIPNIPAGSEFPRMINDANSVTSATFAFPSDFNGSINSARNLFISLDSGGTTDGIFKLSNYTVSPLGTNTAATSVAYAGTYASGKLYAGYTDGTLSYCTTVTSTATFVAAGTGLTGTNDAYVALSGSDVYVGTTGDESAFNASTNGGVLFRQRGLIDTSISEIDDIDMVSSSEWYLTTTADPFVSLWYTTNSGTQYVRINTMNVAYGSVALSMNFATDSTMYFYEWGETSGTMPLLYLSADAGATWSQRAAPADLLPVGHGIGNVVAVDQYVVIIGDDLAPNVYRSVNNGWTYAKAALTGATDGVAKIKVDASTGDILVGTWDGYVFLSTNGTSYTSLGQVSTGSEAAVAFDVNYATNNLIYSNDGASLMRWEVDTSTSWTEIFDGSTYTDNVEDIVVAPDGTLYAIEDGGDLGMIRLLNPTVAAASVLANNITSGLTDYNLDNVLAYASGSNILATINDWSGIVTYTDTLSMALPNVVSPANNDVVKANFAVTVDKVAGATTYDMEWDTRSDYATKHMVYNVAAADFPDTTVRLATGAGNGATVYFRVRVSGPVFGPWSATYTVNTQLSGIVAPNAPAVNIGVFGSGSTNNGGFDVEVMPTFFWGGVPGATSYEFQLGTDPAMNNLVVDATGANALGNVTSYSVTSALDYGATYYWRVRALSATSETDWSIVSAFKVMDEPPASPTPTAVPTITITNTTLPTPTITFTQPAATTTTFTIPAAPATTEVGPAYIWAIIVIGAVLVIAVIVLIVRTRRSV